MINPMTSKRLAYFFDDFQGIHTNQWSTRIVGSSSIYAQNGVGGLCEVYTGIVINNYAEAYITDMTYLHNAYFACRLAPIQTTLVRHQFGLIPQSPNNTEGNSVFFVYDSSLGANWMLYALGSWVDTGTAPSATVMQEFNISCAFDGVNTVVSGIISGNLGDANVSLVIPGNAAYAVGPYMRCTTLTTATRSLMVDWIEVYGNVDTSFTLGTTTVGGSTTSADDGVLVATKVTLGTAALLESLAINVGNAFGSVYLAVYSDNANYPGSLLATTPLFTPASTGWITKAVTAPVVLSPGSYWLVFHPSEAVFGVQFNATGGTGRQAALGNIDVPPLTYPGGASSDTLVYSLYANMKEISPVANYLTLGDSSVLSQTDSNNGFIVAWKVVLPKAGTIQSLSINTPTGAGNLYLSIYNDNAGYPGTRQARTNSFAPANGWNTQPVVTPVALSAGIYWLSFNSNNGTCTQAAYRVSSGTENVYISYAFAAPPSTFPGSANTDTFVYSQYATIQL
jgi:hypothetical protein